MLLKLNLSENEFPNSPVIIHLQDGENQYLQVCKNCISSDGLNTKKCKPGSPHLKCSVCFQYFPKKDQFLHEVSCRFCHKIICDLQTSSCLFRDGLQTIPQFIKSKRNSDFKIDYFRGNEHERKLFFEFLLKHSIEMKHICDVFELMFHKEWTGSGSLKKIYFSLNKEILESIEGRLYYSKCRRIFPQTTVSVFEANKEDRICLDCFEDLFGVFILVFKEGLEVNNPR